jgi:hypothetical protein
MLRSSPPKVAGASSSTTRAPRRSHARAAASTPATTSSAITTLLVRSVNAIFSSFSGWGPERAVRGRPSSAVGGGISGVGSGPPAAITASSAAQSATVRAIGPGWSSEGASGMIPASGIRPWLGFSRGHPPVTQLRGRLEDAEIGRIRGRR